MLIKTSLRSPNSARSATNPKVHVGARDDGDKLLSSADQVVAHDMGFETGKGESTSRFWYRSSLCKVG
jgi:hypothetical protein